MTLNKLFLEIESSEFASRLNLASGERLFMWSLTTDPAVNRLERELEDDANNSLILLGRIQQLVRLEFDFRYENPHDAALSAYCWVLAQFDRSIGRIGAHLVASAKQTWWAHKVAEIVIDDFPASTKGTHTRTDAEAVELFKGAAEANLDEIQSISAAFLLSTLSLQAAKFSMVTSLSAAAESSSLSTAGVPGWSEESEMPFSYSQLEHHQPDDLVLTWED